MVGLPNSRMENPWHIIMNGSSLVLVLTFSESSRSELLENCRSLLSS
jgi:hypothetical protein